MVEVSKKKENSMIILDFGSGNGCGNEKKNIRKLIDSVEGFDCIIKWQLFTSAPPNIPLRYDLFTYAYDYAEKKVYVLPLQFSILNLWSSCKLLKLRLSRLQTVLICITWRVVSTHRL